MDAPQQWLDCRTLSWEPELSSTTSPLVGGPIVNSAAARAQTGSSTSTLGRLRASGALIPFTLADGSRKLFYWQRDIDAFLASRGARKESVDPPAPSANVGA